jgi:hypothetical protein
MSEAHFQVFSIKKVTSQNRKKNAFRCERVWTASNLRVSIAVERRLNLRFGSVAFAFCEIIKIVNISERAWCA